MNIFLFFPNIVQTVELFLCISVNNIKYIKKGFKYQTIFGIIMTLLKVINNIFLFCRFK